MDNSGELDSGQERPRWMRQLMILGVLALVAAACGSDADEPAAAIGVIGEWELTGGTVDGAAFPMVDGRRITLNVSDDGTVGGTAACNSYGGTYVADTEDFIASQLFQTEMACEPETNASEASFMRAIGQPLTYVADPDRLTLRGDQVELIFSPVRPVPAAELIGTVWLLDTLIQGDAASSVLGDPATLLLTGDGRVEGSTGCRDLEGEYVINADTVTFTSFRALGECPEELRAQDNLVVTVLGDGFTAQVDGARLTLESSGREGLGYIAQR